MRSDCSLFPRFSNIIYPPVISILRKRILLKDVIKGANAWEKERAQEEEREPVEIRNPTFHWYRHTFCTNILGKRKENVLKDEQVLKLMGHASIKISEGTYGHMDKSIDDYNIDLNGIVGLFAYWGLP